MVFSCALLHLAFIFLFFGPAGSWTNYSYLLIAGAAAVPIERQLHRYALYALIVVAVSTYYAVIRESIAAWRSTSRTPVTANLWSPTEVGDEWSRVLALCKGRRTAVVHYAGAV
jgi:hypothetical protein